MYFNKFSSGTILALLALSGMLFLVPLAAPVHATQDASLPTLSASQTSYVYNVGTAGTTLKITNPITNSYAITSITIFAPTGFKFTASTGAPGTYLNSESIFTIAAETFTITGSSAGIAPGFSDTVTLGTITATAASPATAAPPTGTFTTTLIDAGSNPASYPGPTWVAYDLSAGTTIAVTGTVSSFTAGSSPLTITATDSTGQPGVPVTFKVNSHQLTTGFTATVSPSTGTTGSTGTVTTSFTPSNWATDSAKISATSGGNAATNGTASGLITTFAANPTKVTFYLGGAPNVFPTTHYVTASATITGGGTALYADIPSGQVSYAATDAFGNSAGTVTLGTITAANGYLTGTTAVNSCLEATTCGGYGLVPQYDQSGLYGSIGQIGATLSGSGFSVSGTTGFIQTSTFASTAGWNNPQNVLTDQAGKSQTFTVLLGTVQTGVPVKIQICAYTVAACAPSPGFGTTKGYSGTFSNGFASISGVTNSSGEFAASLAISTTLGATVVTNATVTKPVDGSANPQSFNVPHSSTITTGPGGAAKFQLYAPFFNSQLAGHTGPSTIYATSGATLYVDAILTDAYGNIVNNALLQQIQITMATSGVSGGGLLSATSIYLSSGCSSTNTTGIVGTCLGSFGPVAWTLPTTLGASTVTATGVINGVAITGSITVTTISPLPTLSVTSPKPVSGVIYSASPFITFSGKANASLGYPSQVTPVTINSIGYKVNSLSWVSSTTSMLNQILWSVPVTLATGLSTIQFNATDSKHNTVVSSSYQVLVDSVAPTFTFAGITTATGCEAVTVTSAAGDFNTASFTATYAGSPISSANIAWAGTQTLGSPSTLTATICGLVAGTGTLSVTGSTYAPISNSASETLTVTVVLADSITFNTGTATYGVIGAYKGVTVSVTNSWGSAQTVVIFATLKSGTSIYVAEGTATIAAGQTNAVVCLDLQTVPAGTYSVTFAAVTTSNAAVSAPVPGVNLVAT